MTLPLPQALTLDPGALRWICGEETAAGQGALEIARPGVRLAGVEGEPEVPRAVFHDWIFRCAERMLKAYIGYGRLEPHEADWLSHSLAMIKVAAEPPGEDAESMRTSALTLLATLGIPARLRGGHPAEMGAVYEWAVEALSWATKRHVRDRRCAVEPPSLCRKAAEIHAAVAEHRGADPEAARRDEREAQLRSLLTCWREALGA